MNLSPKIIQFLTRYRVPYRLSGKNVSSNFIGVNCPYCYNDSKFHMGINKWSGYYTCWRNKAHSGSQLSTILVKLTGCSLNETQYLFVERLLVDDDFNKLKFRMFEIEQVSKQPKQELKFNSEFMPINNVGVTAQFWQYLYDRGLLNPDDIILKYGLMCALTGLFRYRIILPVYMNGKLVTWTSRSIIKHEPLRYLILSGELSCIDINQTLYNYDHINKSGEVLFITEGPFDVIKLYTILPQGFNVTCVFTKRISKEQAFLLWSLSHKYKKLILLLDKGEDMDSVRIVDKLSHINNLHYMPFPKDGIFSKIKDAGEFNLAHIENILEKI